MTDFSPEEISDMQAGLAKLRAALGQPGARITIGSKTMEYRSPAEIREAYRTLDALLASATGSRRTRQVRLVSGGLA